MLFPSDFTSFLAVRLAAGVVLSDILAGVCLETKTFGLTQTPSGQGMLHKLSQQPSYDARKKLLMERWDGINWKISCYFISGTIYEQPPSAHPSIDTRQETAKKM